MLKFAGSEARDGVPDEHEGTAMDGDATLEIGMAVFSKIVQFLQAIECVPWSWPDCPVEW
jgi:hypothetical protein